MSPISFQFKQNLNFLPLCNPKYIAIVHNYYHKDIHAWRHGDHLAKDSGRQPSDLHAVCNLVQSTRYAERHSCGLWRPNTYPITAGPNAITYHWWSICLWHLQSETRNKKASFPVILTSGSWYARLQYMIMDWHQYLQYPQYKNI